MTKLSCWLDLVQSFDNHDLQTQSGDTYWQESWLKLLQL